MSDWKNSLGRFFADFKEQSSPIRQVGEMAKTRTAPSIPLDVRQLMTFVREVAVPAFEELRGELESHGRTVTIRDASTSAAIMVHFNGDEELTYSIHGRTFPNGILPYADIRFRERKGLKILRVEDMVRGGAPDYAIGEVSREEVIANFLEHYTRRVAPAG